MSHPNRLPFVGILTVVDVVSRGLPSFVPFQKDPKREARPVELSRYAAREALDTLRGMAINCRPEWDGHNPACKVGVIEWARLRGAKLCVGGFVYARDFPAVAEEMARRSDLGMSYELARATMEDLDAPVWRVEALGAFTGAAVLLKRVAAYEGTSFRIVGESC